MTKNAIKLTAENNMMKNAIKLTEENNLRDEI
jgi:hypothetical protein